MRETSPDEVSVSDKNHLESLSQSPWPQGLLQEHLHVCSSLLNPAQREHCQRGRDTWTPQEETKGSLKATVHHPHTTVLQSHPTG